MFANRGDHLFVVVNAACKADDIAHMAAAMPGVSVEPVTDRALLALQGPRGRGGAGTAVLPAVAAMRFMDVAGLDQGAIWVSRSGYTGEDGFEISVPDAQAAGLLRASFWPSPSVAPIGLGRARQFAAAGGGALPLRP